MLVIDFAFLCFFFFSSSSQCMVLLNNYPPLLQGIRNKNRGWKIKDYMGLNLSCSLFYFSKRICEDISSRYINIMLKIKNRLPGNKNRFCLFSMFFSVLLFWAVIALHMQFLFFFWETFFSPSTIIHQAMHISTLECMVLLETHHLLCNSR